MPYSIVVTQCLEMELRGRGGKCSHKSAPSESGSRNTRGIRRGEGFLLEEGCCGGEAEFGALAVAGLKKASSFN